MADALCPTEYSDHLSRMILDQIADKWSILIIAALCSGPMRFNGLKRELNGVTQKALTQTLRRLERLGLIERRVFPVSPVAVEYSVTPLGESLKAPFQAIFQWSVAHGPEIEAAKQRFDRERDGA
ncbi:helix-turn-helix transcriptional regulator [Agrobacterium salinitolerans]|uniref:Helix-turn-helix transcriptional regulator n=1 Tax=Agrobacterium salinitolerans TaxID=1183413 RepID=A0A4Z1QST3_9HYPH|nr:MULTISPECIES: helix-turn-helix domain-containing protein [Agrobacterium]NTA35795.1 helix-turn-helix transcriptional regulator [Agrobacterium salinitolerans]RRN74594.1 transcriptional regulator [Agrobacterium deltaense]UYZ07372.1 helix-turn-helix transcriptional regulator [Agrobacterium salinitolerans]